MQPIEVKISGYLPRSSQEICAEFLDMERWPEFKGYSILLGIKCASFETRTTELVGSRIRVQNTDGSSHVEEIIAWDENNRIALRFDDFDPPLKSLATHFIETWEFRKSSDGTKVTRSMSMYPKGTLGRLMLIPVSRLMKKAFEKNLNEAKGKPT